MLFYGLNIYRKMGSEINSFKNNSDHYYVNILLNFNTRRIIIINHLARVSPPVDGIKLLLHNIFYNTSPARRGVEICDIIIISYYYVYFRIPFFIIFRAMFAYARVSQLQL